MAGKKRRELDPDNPDDMKKAREHAKKVAKEMFNNGSFPGDFAETGVLTGNVEKILAETEEDCYLQELDEYSPEERRQKFKIHTKNKDGNNEK
ncbi:hypothetical protein MNBD_GAMMA18-1883 [hydrothermal vent metagenome]|uniref:Uncharacterized protein n=1 Tax=hydrothermal vent metagenome TaxID=652676 RepID=A0A3B0YTR7_9ZZZZ